MGAAWQWRGTLSPPGMSARTQSTSGGGALKTHTAVQQQQQQQQQWHARAQDERARAHAVVRRRQVPNNTPHFFSDTD